jgi:uncharacterized membrane protein (DUF373 family)
MPRKTYWDVISAALQRTQNPSPMFIAYERFEQVVSFVISLVVSAVIVVALVHLIITISELIALGFVDPTQQEVFQTIFGMVLTVLIALEFNHSIVHGLQRRHGIVQVRTVVLIAILALVRKFIVVDAAHAEPMTILGLAASVLALGAVYWLIREQDRREAASEGVPGSDGREV